MKTIKIYLTITVIFISLNSFSQFKILSNGNVGINDATPNAKLDITASTNSKGFSLNTYNTTNYKNSTEVRNRYNTNTHNWVVYYGSTSTTKRFYVNGLGYVYAYGAYITSDGRYKKDVETIKNPLDKVLKLRGVSYYFNNIDDTTLLNNASYHNKKQIGLIAQEVEIVIPEVVSNAEDGKKAVAYQNLVGLLIEAVKEQQTQIDELKKEVKGLKNDSKKSSSSSSSSNNQIFIESKLFQNNPNPFNETTSISYIIPNDITNAQILVFNMQGVKQEEYNLTNGGRGDVTINGGAFKPGMYVYTLIVDGNVIDTKNMIITD